MTINGDENKILSLLSGLKERELPPNFESEIAEKLDSIDLGSASLNEAKNAERERVLMKKLKRYAYVAIGVAACFMFVVFVTKFIDSIYPKSDRSVLTEAASEGSAINKEGAAAPGEGGNSDRNRSPEMNLITDEADENKDSTLKDITEERRDGSASSDTKKTSDDISAAGTGIEKTDRKLIYSANMKIEIESYEEFDKRLKQLVGVSDGYIEAAQAFTEPVYRNGGKKYDIMTGSYTIRIPAKSYADSVGKISEMGEVTSRNENVKDISAVYRDTEAMAENLKVREKAVREMMDKATNLEESLFIYNELSDLRYRIDGLTTNLKRYDEQVSYSTINISFTEKVEEIVEREPIDENLGTRISNSFNESMNSLGKFFENVAVTMIGKLPIAMFAIVMLAVIIGIGFIIVKVIIKRLKKQLKGGSTNEKD